MPTQRIIDLDKIAPPDVVIVADGQEYRLPGDPPLAVWLPLVDAAETYNDSEGAETQEALKDFADRMLTLFQVRDPGLQVLPLGSQQLFAVLRAIYDTDLGEERPVDPPRRRAAGTTTSSRRTTPKPKATPTRSRSSSS